MLGFSQYNIDFNLLFQRSDMLVLAMYTNEFIIIAGSREQFMMCCEKILTSKDGMNDKGGRQGPLYKKFLS